MSIAAILGFLAQTTIPLCAGLSIVGAVNEPHGDYESITTIQSVDANEVNIAFSTQVATPTSIRNVNAARKVLLRDLASATIVVPWFNPLAPRTYPGTTAFGPSSGIIRALKTRGTADMGIFFNDTATTEIYT